MRVVREGVVKLSDADILFLMLPAMLTSAATRLLAHLAPFPSWLIDSIGDVIHEDASVGVESELLDVG